MKALIRNIYYSIKTVYVRARLHWKGVVFHTDAFIANTVSIELHPYAKMIVGRSTLESGSRFRIFSYGKIILADDVICRPNVYMVSCGELHVGKNSYFNHNAYIGCNERIEIGENVLVGPNVVVVDADHVITQTHIPINQQGMNSRPVIIEDDVWLCANCTVTKGARIGRGAVVGANAVVIGEVPPYAVVGGCPAKVLKFRAPESSANLEYAHTQ